MVMICAQLMAFGRVHRLREESKEKRRLKKEHAEAGKIASSGTSIAQMNGHALGHLPNATFASNARGSIHGKATWDPSTSSESPNGRLYDKERCSSEDSEVIL